MKHLIKTTAMESKPVVPSTTRAAVQVCAAGSLRGVLTAIATGREASTGQVFALILSLVSAHRVL